MTSEDVQNTLNELGMNQSQAAKFFGVDTRTVRRWQRNGVGAGPSRVVLRLALKIFRENGALKI